MSLLSTLAPPKTSRGEDDCDFCSEFRGVESTFSRIYGSVPASRIVAQSNAFLAVPTIGPLFDGHLLVLPREHRETLASCPSELMIEATGFAGALANRISKQSGPVVMFEHGAAKRSGGGCGVYHAHLHIVPLPRQIAASDLLPINSARVRDLSEALNQLRFSEQYFLIGDENGFHYLDLSGSAARYPSQYLRRRILELLAPGRPWNWRDAIAPEASLLATLAAYAESSSRATVHER